ncbi:GNAT family N-acetyltransferase [Brevibacillus fluminis]|uniref:GNAT family N-acetyltransferase n=1 Tax=Brevibacillus fluminis TaxID=511487 RepID=UPI003F89DDAD
MVFRIQEMDERNARMIAAWHYPPPYDFYNLGSSPEAVAEMLEHDYYTIYTEDNELLGFYCLGPSAQVPAGHQSDAYAADTPTIDIGIGMRPDLTGKGFGFEFFSIVLGAVKEAHPHASVRLTVASFNKRAIRLYENCGFAKTAEFTSPRTQFVTMTLAAPVPCTHSSRK